MASYYQETEYYEDGYGMVKETFVVTDQHHSIFDNAAIGKCEDTTVFTTGGTYTGTAALTYTVQIDGVKTGAITAFADAGGGYVTATSAGHSLLDGDYVEIFGNASYNGTYVVTNKQTDSFDFLKAFVADGTATFMSATFKWSNDDGTTWEAEDVPITKAVQTLEAGITITFANISGHAVLDNWRFSTRINANIFDYEDVTKSQDIGTGILTEDEMKIGISEANVKTTAEAAALQFVLDAQTTANKRFAALFVDASTVTTFDKDNCLFSSVIRPEMKAKILQWSGSPWGTAITPLHEWDITASPVFENLLDYDLKECIDGIELTEPGWEAANVSDKLGYWSYNDVDMAFHRLVDLNAVLRILAAVVIDKLEANNVGKYQINFTESYIDGKFRPARFSKTTHQGGPALIIGYLDADDILTPSSMIAFPNDDTAEIKAMALGSTDEYVSPFIHYGLIKFLSETDGGYEVNYAKAEDYQWHKSVKTFTDLLYKLAQVFGMFVKFSYTDQTTVNIEFLNRKDFASTQVYIVDATEDSIDLKSTTNETDAFTGLSFYLAHEGGVLTADNEYYPWLYFYNAKDKTYESGGMADKIRTGERLPLTLSPTIREIHHLYGTSLPTKVFIPHNAIRYVNDALSSAVYADSRGVTTAIYMKVLPYSSDDGEPVGYHYLPAGLWSINEGDGEGARDYPTIADRLNRLYEREIDYYETERNITVPAINGFSANSDGSSRTWKALSLGKKITLDGVDYVVVQIVHDMKNKATKLKLHNIGRFSYSDPTPTDEPTAKHETVKSTLNGFVTRTATGAINRGDVVSHIAGGVTQDDTVERSEATADHYGRLLGIALSTVADGERVRVQISGEVYMEDVYNLNGTGNRVFLRTNGAGINVSETMLTDKDADEDLFAEIGTKTSKYSFKIAFKQWIYE